MNAVTPDSGANDGKFHHSLVIGTCFAFHARVDVFSGGSPRSLKRFAGITGSKVAK